MGMRADVDALGKSAYNIKALPAKNSGNARRNLKAVFGSLSCSDYSYAQPVVYPRDIAPVKRTAGGA